MKNRGRGVSQHLELRSLHHMRHVPALSPAASIDCAYFPSPRGCTSLCGNWFVRPYIESRYFADHNMLGSATTKIRLPHRLVYLFPFHGTERERRDGAAYWSDATARCPILVVCSRWVTLRSVLQSFSMSHKILSP